MVTQRSDLTKNSPMIPETEASNKSKGSLVDSFQSYISDNNQSLKKTNEVMNSTANTKTDNSRKSEFDKINASYSKQADRMNNRVKQTDKVDASYDDAEGKFTQEELDELKENIYAVVREAMGLTDEEIDSVLETMGITVFQLLKPEVLQEFLMTQTGTEAVDMLTNSELIQTLQDMNQGMQALLDAQEINLTPEDLEAYVDALELADQNPEPATDSQEAKTDLNIAAKSDDEKLSEITATEKNVEEMVADVQNSSEKIAVSADKNAERVSVKDSNAEVKDTKETQKSSEYITATDENSGIQVSVRNADTKREQFSDMLQQQNPNFAGDIVNHLAQAINETETSSYTSMLEQQDIVRQVIEQIRVWNSNNGSRMQVQLYPEHLGRIEVQVMLRNGVMTAQITAETEMAKAAIESQLQALKESFEQKNMQVNAIEVSVGTPDFRKDEERKDADERNAKAGSRRKNGIQGITDSSDEETEDESAERLEARGASVEFEA